MLIEPKIEEHVAFAERGQRRGVDVVGVMLSMLPEIAEAPSKFEDSVNDRGRLTIMSGGHS